MYTARQGAATEARERRYENEHRGTEATEGHGGEEIITTEDTEEHEGMRREQRGIEGDERSGERREGVVAKLTGMVNIAVFAAFRN